MDEGTFVKIGLMQNPKGDFILFDQSLRELMGKYTTNDGILCGIKEIIQQKDYGANEIITSLNHVSAFLYEKGYLFLAIEISKLAIFFSNDSNNEIKIKCLRRIANSFYHCELDDESSIYYEVSTLDYYMEAYVRNFESTSISEFITYGIGLAYKLLRRATLLFKLVCQFWSDGEKKVDYAHRLIITLCVSRSIFKSNGRKLTD